MVNRPASALAAVRIGIDDYILPMADALKLVEIMGRARPVERHYGARREYVLRDHDALTQVDLTLVHERDIKAAKPATPRLLALPAPGGRT